VSVRGFKGRHPIRRRARGEKVLEPILDPLDRPTGFPRGNGYQDDIRENRLFDTKAAARVQWGLEPQPARRHAEGQRHDRVERQGPLKVGGDLVGMLPGEVFGDDDEALDWRAAVTRILSGNRDPIWRHGKSGFGVSIAKVPVANDIVSGRPWIEPGRQRSVGDVDHFECVLGPVAVAGDDDGDRLALIAHALGREAPVLDRRLDSGDKRPGPAPGVLGGHDAIDTRHRQCPSRIDR
jgi:hypothetical protein